LKLPSNIPQAYALIDAHPAFAKGHLALALLAAPGAPIDRGSELSTAAWLAPTDPYFRDIYAQSLLAQGDSAGVLSEITRSVFNSPEEATHFYLNPRIVPHLPEPERQAISAGFRLAADHRFDGAAENFAGYEDALGDTKAEAEIYTAAAASETGSAQRAVYLEDAGSAYLKAGEPKHAEAALRGAIAADPANSDAYVRLIDGVFGPAKDWLAANALIGQGIEQGAGPAVLYRALAQAAQAAGAYAAARGALQKALAVQPADFDTIMQAGLLEVADNHPDQAALWFRRAAQLRPRSAEAFA
jgi:tetratricopeptide (TPR) repeat protein